MVLQKIYRYAWAARIWLDGLIFKAILRLYGARSGSARVTGLPHITIRRGAVVSIGDGFRINSCFYGNALSTGKCAVWVGENARLDIGRNVGISSSYIVAVDSVTIGDNVKIGGNCYIIDTDFHSIDPEKRKYPDQDRNDTRTAPVTIRENAFIGAASIILKGVTIGKGAVIGAGSVVTRDVPDGQLWAGNPARFIREL